MKHTRIVLIAALLAATLITTTVPAVAQGTPPAWPPAMARRIIHQDSSATWLAFSPDGKTLATSGFDGAIRVWDAASGKRTLATRFGDRGTRWFFAVLVVVALAAVVAVAARVHFRNWRLGIGFMVNPLVVPSRFRDKAGLMEARS